MEWVVIMEYELERGKGRASAAQKRVNGCIRAFIEHLIECIGRLCKQLAIFIGKSGKSLRIPLQK
jgi:hypothetical protein